MLKIPGAREFIVDFLKETDTSANSVDILGQNHQQKLNYKENKDLYAALQVNAVVWGQVKVKVWDTGCDGAIITHKLSNSNNLKLAPCNLTVPTGYGHSCKAIVIARYLEVVIGDYTFTQDFLVVPSLQ